MGKRNGTQYVENPGECPFCGSDEIDGGVDNSFESDSMISGGCKCNSCGKTWSESYKLDGWIENNDDGPDEFHQDMREQEHLDGIQREHYEMRLILEEIMEQREGRMHGRDAWEATNAKARAAIAKAKGE